MSEPSLRIISDLVTTMIRESAMMADFYPGERKITYKFLEGGTEVDFGKPLTQQDYNSTVSRLELMAAINIARSADELGHGRIQLKVSGADHLFDVSSSITDEGKYLTLKRKLG